MRINIKYLFLSWVLLFPGCSIFFENNDSSEKKSITIWLIGDSTVTDYSKDKDYISEKYPKTGWGQVFQAYVIGTRRDSIRDLLQADSVVVNNKAVGGRSTRSFFQEGRWREVYDSLKNGDFVFIQFGHNDASVKKTERYVDTMGYKEFLRLFISQSREKGAIPLLITPVARNYPWEADTLRNVHGTYPAAMKEIAEETNTMIIDLNTFSMEFFTEKSRDYVTQYYFMNLPAGIYSAFPDGETDNTHFQPEGAEAVAKLVYKGLKELTSKKTVEK
jgi:lysophospholipase L1-like esterase